MATSPSDPYQSRIIRAVLTRTRQLIDRGQTTIRRMQVAASWSAQVVLYPVYALFQTARLLGHQVDKAVQIGLAAEPPSTASDAIRTDWPTRPLTVDSPLQHVLQAVQPFLPADMPVVLPEAQLVIRAIASSLETKALLLVDTQNRTLDVLTATQQQQLDYLIQAELIKLRRQQQFWQLPKRLLTRAQVTVRSQLPSRLHQFQETVRSRLPGLHQFQETVRSRVLQRLNPLQEQVRSRLPGQLPPLQLPPVDLTPLMPTLVTLDTPIHASLQAVQQMLPSIPFTEVLSRPAALVASFETASAAIAPTVATPIVPKAALSTTAIRGVASMVETRSLVLVTTQNTVLDILTPAQQQHIQRRLIWEVAHYLRYLRLCRQTQQIVPLRPPRSNSPMLPPVRAFHWVMAWMQVGPIAVATNLFHETSITACPLPFQAPPASLPPAETSALVNGSTTAIASVWSTVQQTLAQPHWKAWLAPLTRSVQRLPFVNPTVDADASSPLAPSDQIAVEERSGHVSSPAIADPLTILTNRWPTVAPNAPMVQTNGQTDLQIEVSGRSALSNQAAATAWLETNPTDESRFDEIYIDTEVTLMGYEQSLLERVIRFLDRCFVWVEELFSQVWHWLVGK